MRFENLRIAGVPLLLVHRDDLQPPLPAVLWFHGLASCKEDNRAELSHFARAGLLAVGVDAVGHGERRHPELQRYIDAPRDETLRFMIDLVQRTASEVPSLIDGLHAAGISDGPAASVVGVSMGGYIAYAAMIEEPRLRSVVSLLGNPQWPHARSPAHRVAELTPIPLLSITAERDESVPPQHAREFHRQLEPLYRTAPGTLRYHEIPHAPHLMSGEDWWRAMDLALDWTTRFSPPVPPR